MAALVAENTSRCLGNDVLFFMDFLDAGGRGMVPNGVCPKPAGGNVNLAG